MPRLPWRLCSSTAELFFSPDGESELEGTGLERDGMLTAVSEAPLFQEGVSWATSGHLSGPIVMYCVGVALQGLGQKCPRLTEPALQFWALWSPNSRSSRSPPRRPRAPAALTAQSCSAHYSSLSHGAVQGVRRAWGKWVLCARWKGPYMTWGVCVSPGLAPKHH